MMDRNVKPSLLVSPFVVLISVFLQLNIAHAQGSKNSSQNKITVGKFVINPQFNDAKDFSDGLAAVRKSEKGKYGFIDKTGRFVI